MDERKRLKTLIRDIEAGKLTVKWDGWSFSAGHWYDTQNFSLQEDKVIYRLMLTMDGQYLNTYGIEIAKDEEDDLIRRLKNAVKNAVKRDDKEFVSLVSDENGTLCWLADYCDIDRGSLQDWISLCKQ